MGGGAVEYDGGEPHTALATHRYADKARRIVGLAAQMGCVAERRNGCVARFMRLALNQQSKFACVEPTSCFEP